MPLLSLLFLYSSLVPPRIAALFGTYHCWLQSSKHTDYNLQ